LTTLVIVGLLLLAVIYLLGDIEEGRQAPRAERAASTASTSTPTAATSPATTPPVPIPATVGTAEDPTPQVRLIPETFDFGVMKPGSLYERTIMLRNVSPDPIRVLGTKKTCSCTTVQLEPDVLQPGEEVPVTAIMAADFTPKDKSNVKVVVQYEGYAPSTILMDGYISHAVSTTPRELRMHPRGYNDSTYRTNGSLTLRSTDGTPFRVLRSGGKAPVFLVPGSTSDTAAQSHGIRWDASEFDRETGLNEAGERIPAFWLVETDHPEAPVIEVALNHQVDRLEKRGARPWFTIDRRAVADQVDPGGSAEILLPMNGLLGPDAAADMVDGVLSTSPDFTTELIGMERHIDGKRVNLRIRVTPDPDLRGAYMAPVRIVSPSSEMTFHIIGSVRDPDA
jgi:hypothetical protein